MVCAVMLVRLVRVMRMVGLLSPESLIRLSAAICRSGVNLLALLDFAAGMYGDRTALVDEMGAISYRELYGRSRRLAYSLQQKYSLGPGRNVAVLGRNSSRLVRTIVAASASGADVCFLNPELSGEQLRDMLIHLQPDLIMYDEEFRAKVVQAEDNRWAMCGIHEIDQLLPPGSKGRFRPSSSGKLVLMTAGTTGKPKQAAHRPSLTGYLSPFVDFVTRLKVMEVQSAYIATPVYHGYGLAVTILCLALGKTVAMQRGFDAARACKLVREHRIGLMTVVPTMLHKMLKAGADDLQPLRCIACGGAELSPQLAEATLRRLGNVLYNLYGTSEAGLNFIATPEDLRHNPRTVGKPLKGVRVRILNDRDQPAAIGEIGRILVCNEWSAVNRAAPWIDTGDLGYVDQDGYYYLRGRADSMIVSGGENVYPLEVEQVVLSHPQVEDAAAVAVPDEEYGQRLKLYVAPVSRHDDDAGLTEEELRGWLRERLARYQMPREIELVGELPYTSLGKLDRKRLQALAVEQDDGKRS